MKAFDAEKIAFDAEQLAEDTRSLLYDVIKPYQRKAVLREVFQIFVAFDGNPLLELFWNGFGSWDPVSW